MINGKKSKSVIKSLGQKGFTLLEVMIAMTVFTIFITAYLTSEGYKVSDSTMLKNELLLNKLCQNKLNEIILAPPPLEESLTLSAKEGNFEEEGYPNFTYTVEYKRMKIPDLSQLQGSGSGNDNEENADTNEDDGQNILKKSMQKQIFDTLKKNIEELIWQVKVTVKEKGTDFPYSLSTLINNSKARIRVEF